MKQERLSIMRNTISEILELEDGELTDDSLFVEEHGADSLRAVEILSRIEKQFEVKIPQNDLTRMTNLSNVYAVVEEHANWKD